MRTEVQHSIYCTQFTTNLFPTQGKGWILQILYHIRICHFPWCLLNIIYYVNVVYCEPKAKAGFCALRKKLSPEAKPRGFQLYTRHKRPFLLEVHILFCPAAEQKRVFAFENIQSGFEVRLMFCWLLSGCYLSFLWSKLSYIFFIKLVNYYIRVQTRKKGSRDYKSFLDSSNGHHWLGSTG